MVILATVSDIPGLFDVELPDGRQLIDITGGQLAYLAEKHRCAVEVQFRGPQVTYLPMKPRISDYV